jgi:hypothetical protein
VLTITYIQLLIVCVILVRVNAIAMTRWMLFFALALFILSCKKNDDHAGTTTTKKLQFPEDVPGDSISVGSFPLALGHAWTYHVKAQTFAQNDTPDVKEYDITIRVAADTLVNGFHLYKMVMDTAASTNGEPFLSDDVAEFFPSYYVQTASGLYYLKYISQVDAAFINQSLQILQYPASPWHYHYLNSSYHPEKQTMGFYKVATPLSDFNCLKIHVASYAGDYKFIDQYFSDKGLIRQTMEMRYYATWPGRYEYILKLMTLKSVNF